MSKNKGNRFWERVNVLSDPKKCWLWKIGCSNGEYGSFAFMGKCFVASRIAYELTRGEIPEGMCVLHTCDNRKCCNPNHLFLGTIADNNKDKTIKGRQARGPKHALKGEATPYAKLTWEDVCSIRARRESGEILCNIAKDFGIAMQTVSKIHRRTIWRVQK